MIKLAYNKQETVDICKDTMRMKGLENLIVTRNIKEKQKQAESILLKKFELMAGEANTTLQRQTEVKRKPQIKNKLAHPKET